MIIYTDTIVGIAADNLRGGFFVGWPDPPSAEMHLTLLKSSDQVLLALDDVTGHVVGFITALTDCVTSAYIPLLEVLSPYRGRGIGTELMQRMLDKLHGLYIVALTCSVNLQSFYARFDMRPATGMIVCNYKIRSYAVEVRV